MSGLTPAQQRQYESEGYTAVPNVIEPDTLRRLRDITDEIVAGARGLTGHTDALDLEASHTPDEPRVRRIKRPHTVHPFYWELACHQGIMAALIPLIGEHIRLRPAGKVNIKAPGYGAAIEWHQDWAFYPHTNQDVLAVGVLLDDMGPDNGPLLMLPGTHKGPVYDHHHEGAFCGAIDIAKAGIDVTAANEVHATAGSITIHHARLVHGSAMNRSRWQRRVLFYEYTAADAWPLAGIDVVRDLDEFNGRMVHGEPTLTPRMEDVPVRVPLPTAVYQGSIYENQRTLKSRFFDQIPDHLP